MTSVKRVVALEHDVVRHADKKQVYTTVPSGHCWVEGDNHEHSADSNSYGAVRKPGPGPLGRSQLAGGAALVSSRPLLHPDLSALPDTAGASRWCSPRSRVAALECTLDWVRGQSGHAPGAPRIGARGGVSLPTPFPSSSSLFPSFKTCSFVSSRLHRRTKKAFKMDG